MLATEFIFKVNSIEDIKRSIYITVMPLSENILKNIGFVFKYYKVDTRDKTLFTFSSSVYAFKEAKKL